MIRTEVPSIPGRPDSSDVLVELGFRMGLLCLPVSVCFACVLPSIPGRPGLRCLPGIPGMPGSTYEYAELWFRMRCLPVSVCVAYFLPGIPGMPGSTYEYVLDSRLCKGFAVEDMGSGSS
jgi:hypothetical protein